VSRVARPDAWAHVERLKIICSAQKSADSERWAIATMSEWLRDDAEASSSDQGRRFIARGVIGDQGDNATRVGRFTFLARAGADWYQWDGAHRATQFDTPGAARVAADSCRGPWFNLPVSRSVEVVSVPSMTILGSMRSRMHRAAHEGVPPHRFLDNEIARGAALRESTRAVAREVGLATQLAASALLGELD
jgi:hypothetical protein